MLNKKLDELARYRSDWAWQKTDTLNCQYSQSNLLCSTAVIENGQTLFVMWIRSAVMSIVSSFIHFLNKIHVCICFVSNLNVINKLLHPIISSNLLWVSKEECRKANITTRKNFQNLNSNSILEILIQFLLEGVYIYVVAHIQKLWFFIVSG